MSTKPKHADTFAKLPLDEIIAELKKRDRWPFKEGTLFLNYDKYDSKGVEQTSTKPLVADVEEVAVYASVPTEIVERLEAEHLKHTGNRMAWTVAIAATCCVNDTVFFSPDPAGGCALFAKIKEEQQDGSTVITAAGVFPVTLGEWKRFATATNFAATNWQSPGFPQSDSHPTVCISYIDVQEFIKWRNGGVENGPTYVPSEDEWLLAATNGDGRTYPWGEKDPSGAEGEELLQWSGYENKSGTSSVHAHWRGMSPFGIHDQAGNTWEWTSTEHKG